MRSPRPVMSNVSFTVSFTLAFGPVALVQFVRGCSSDPLQGVGDLSPPLILGPYPYARKHKNFKMSRPAPFGGFENY